MAQQLSDISFWAHQFFEHFTLIRVLLDRNYIEIDSSEEHVLDSLASQWQQIHGNPKLFKSKSQIVDDSRVCKTHFRDEFKKAKVPCVPELLTHMLEELDYFERAVVEKTVLPLDEFEYWATEHAENLDFANCELPILIKEDIKASGKKKLKISDIPLDVKQMSIDNEKLSTQFKVLANKLRSAHSLSTQLTNKMFQLKKTHLNGLKRAIDGIGDLPLSKETKKLLHEMLHHELSEAEYAFDRLEKIKTK